MTLWDELADADGTLAEAVLRAAWRSASRAGDTVTLAQLAGRADLPADLVGAARTHRQAAVRGAWLARPGRSPQEMRAAAEAERSVSALAAAVAASDDPTLLEVATERVGPSGAAAIVTKPGLPVPVLVRLIARLAARYATPERLYPSWASDAVTRTLVSRADAHGALAACGLPVGWYEMIADSATLDAAAQAALLDVIDTAAGSARSRVLVLLALASNPALEPSAAARVPKTAARIRQTCRVTAWHEAHLGDAVKLASKRRSSWQIAAARNLAFAARETNAERLAALAQAAVATGADQVIAALAENPHTPASVLVGLLGHLPDDRERPLVQRLAATDFVSLTDLAAAEPRQIVHAGVHQRDLADAVVRRYAAAAEPVDWPLWRAALAYADPELDVVLRAPWRALPACSTRMRGEIGRWIADRLDGNLAAYDVLDRLADESRDVPLGDLVNAAALLAAPAPAQSTP